MNRAKAMLKKQPEKKNKRGGEKKNKGRSKGRIIAIAAAAVLLLAVCVLIGMEQLKRDVAMTVSGEKLYYDDMMYYALLTESQMSYTDQMYQSTMGTSFWDSVGEDGKSNQQLGKETIQKQMEETAIMYLEAKKAGYELTEEDKTEVKENLDFAWQLLNKSQRDIGKFTKEHLTKLLNKVQIAQRYKEDLIDTFAIDDDAIKAGIKYDDYRQYDVEYYFAPITETGEDGESKEISEMEKNSLLGEMNSLRTKGETAEDFSKLIGEDEETVITYKSQSFTFQESDTVFEEDLKKQLSQMKNNEISEVLKREDGYYFFKMKNNDSAESYDKAVEKAISDKETEAFNEEYEKLYPNYTIKVNQKVWDSLVMGRLTSAGASAANE